MSDIISRQNAIEALGEEPDIWNDTEEEWAYRNAWVEHISAIKALPSADRPTGEWVSVSKKLPERSVLCCDCHGEFIIGFLAYEDDQFICENDNEIMYDPIAWMPLPEPYKSGEDE